MRVVVHDALDEPSRFGVLCHELAHILLGHLGGDAHGWWPPRLNLDHDTVEIEAEAVAQSSHSDRGDGTVEGYPAPQARQERCLPGVARRDRQGGGAGGADVAREAVGAAAAGGAERPWEPLIRTDMQRPP